MSLRKAINGKCKDCIYDDLAAGTWRQQVTICSSEDCPLFHVRPKSKSTIPEAVLTGHGVKLDDLKDVNFKEGDDKDNLDSSPQVVKLDTS